MFGQEKPYIKITMDELQIRACGQSNEMLKLILTLPLILQQLINDDIIPRMEKEHDTMIGVFRVMADGLGQVSRDISEEIDKEMQKDTKKAKKKKAKV